MSVESKFENKYRNYKVDFIELLDEVEEGSLPVLSEMRAELDEVYTQAPKADEYEVKNKELLEELKYLKKVNDDLVWQRDTDEEHESKAKAFDEIMKVFENNFGAADSLAKLKVFTEVENAYIESGDK